MATLLADRTRVLATALPDMPLQLHETTLQDRPVRPDHRNHGFLGGVVRRGRGRAHDAPGSACGRGADPCRRALWQILGVGRPGPPLTEPPLRVGDVVTPFVSPPGADLGHYRDYGVVVEVGDPGAVVNFGPVQGRHEFTQADLLRAGPLPDGTDLPRRPAD